MSFQLRRRLSEVTPPRATLRARLLAAGFGGGIHRAERRGSGVEFASHREYMPGDDLRHLDRHALLRHGRHLIREFHTETERALWLLVDASPSMYFRGENTLDSKRGVALLLAAGLAQLARRSGDPVGVSLLRPAGAVSLAPRSGVEQFERIMSLLEQEDQGPLTGDVTVDVSAAIDDIGRRAARGSGVVVISDLLDRAPRLATDLASLCTKRRSVTVAQVLDPDEVNFPYRGAIRLRDAESSFVVDTDAERVREGYLQALARLSDEIARAVRGGGGEFLRVQSSDNPALTLRQIQRRIAGQPERDYDGGGS